MIRRFTPMLLLAAGLMLPATRSHATSIGTLSNFDVVNDSGHDCHGFEIELEDVHTIDVPYTFGGSYSRYGAPEVVDATVDPAHPRVIVRYRHWSGSQWEATPVAPAGIRPSGHDCFAGGPVGNYLTSGCEHYGVSMRTNPTRTTYRWLVAANPADQATAFAVVPENVNLPVPVWNVAPVVGGGGGGVVVNVRAEVEPVEEENHAQFGVPQWMKVYKIKSDLDLHPEDLDKLLFGLANGIVPDGETEIETEWKLIQSKPGDAEGADEDADVKEDPLDGNKRSVIRRYEFYTYTGPLDPENNEAFPCIADDSPTPADAPVDGCSDLGDFVGAQNVAVDVDLTTVDNALPLGGLDVNYPDTALALGGLAPYTVEVTGGALPEGVAIDPATGVLSGRPQAVGVFSFTVRVSDSAGGVATGSFDLAVDDDQCPDDPDKVAPGACGCGVPDDDSDGDGSADCVDLCPLDPAKTDPGACGCDLPESACADLCPDDPAKSDPGVCGCGVADDDTDGDGSADCVDLCPADPAKTDAGACGCGVADDDSNANGIVDCQEAVVADLGAGIKPSSTAPKAARRLRFVLRATNYGPNQVPDATIAVAITGGPYAGLKMPKACSGPADAIVCTTGKIRSGRRPGSKTRTISLIPAAGASITVSMSVSSPVYDPNPANQSAAVTSDVP